MIRNIVFALILIPVIMFTSPQYKEDDVQYAEGNIVNIDFVPASPGGHALIILDNMQSYVVTFSEGRNKINASAGKYARVGYVISDVVRGGPNLVVDLVIDGVRYQDVNTVNRDNLIGYFVCGFLALLMFIGINLKVIFEWIEKRKIIAKNKRKKREREKRKAEREARKLNQSAIDLSEKT